jgi:hypothetical protein
MTYAPVTLSLSQDLKNISSYNLRFRIKSGMTFLNVNA